MLVQTEAREGRFRPQMAFLAETTLSFGNLDGVGPLPIGGRYVLVSPLFRGYVRVAENWALSAAWGFASESEDGETTWGNPFVAGHTMVDLGDGTARIGVGVALPTATGQPDPEEYLFGLPITVRVGQQGYLFMPDTLAVVAPMRIETFTSVLVAAELTAGVLVPTGGAADRRPAAYFEILGELGAIVDDVDFGVRVGAAATAGAEATLLSFVEPFFRWHLGLPYVHGRFTYGLDDPDQSVPEGRWGITVGVGAEIE